MNKIFTKRVSQQSVCIKKIEIATSHHSEEPPWDIVVELTDLCNNDGKIAKQVISHLKKIFEQYMKTSLDNQGLRNCLQVLDSFARNGNNNIVSVIHSNFLPSISKFLLMAEKDDKAQSLLESTKKSCKEYALELILVWAFGMDQVDFPLFKTTYFKLLSEGLPFTKIDKSKIVPLRAPPDLPSTKKDKKSESNGASPQQKPQQSVEKEEKEEYSPWEKRNLRFGTWYKKKLKQDLKLLADMICMAQDVISMQNVEDVYTMHVELREAMRRLISIAFRAQDPAACDTLMQWIVIVSGLMDCCHKLENGHRARVPGISRQHLQMLINCL